MPHIHLKTDAPGIIGPMIDYPATAKHLNGLAEALLCKETKTFSKAERETVASYVSNLNNCVFCSESHAAVADEHWQKHGTAKQIWNDTHSSSKRLAQLLKIASTVQKDARQVAKADVDEAIQLGATEEDIHDTVLIAAAFCMFNRYVDGLATFAPPRGHEAYLGIGKMLKDKGYENSLEN